MLEREKEKAIAREVMTAVNRAKELKSDFLGLGEMIYREYPGVWERIKGEWREKWLPTVDVRVKVCCKIRRSGATVGPLQVRSQ